MNYLSVEDITKSFGDRVIFDKLTFGIDQGQKVAIVAKNGNGKTTLLRCLLGQEPIDEGRIVFRKGLRIAFMEQSDDLNYFKELLKEHINKIMICTNPDLIVDKGNRRELCAGSVALVFEKMGGEVIYFGKPFPDVYNQAINNEGKRVLSIGDNLNTDIKGANLLNYNSLIISNGVHRDEIKKEGIDVISKKYEVVVNFIQTELKW